MPRFLIEIPHEAETVACAKAVHVLLSTGSHFLTHADWGCTDGVHKGWIIVEVDNKDEARRIPPPIYRAQADIVLLNKFGLEEIEDLLRHHKRE
jgi:nicotinate-nucleotide pyrophosphorylase